MVRKFALPHRPLVGPFTWPQVAHVLRSADQSAVVPAFLRLSAASNDQPARANAAGWPVRRLARHPLATITHPDEIASAMLELTCAVA